MDFFLILRKVSVLFLLIVVGYIVGRVNIISENGQKELSTFVLRVTMPATIILALQVEFTKERFNTCLKIILITIFSYIGMIILSKAMSRLLKVNNEQMDIIQVATILPNTSFMGYPIVLSILGKEALFMAVLGTGLIFEVVAWTYGVFTIGRTTGFHPKRSFIKTIIMSPGIVSIIIGFTLFILSIRVPEPINTTMGLLSQVTSPLAMIIVGIFLSRSSIKECITNVRLYIVAAIRLLIFPMLIFITLSAIGATGMEIGIPVIMLAMPTAAYVAMFSSNEGNDTNFASQIIFISSLFSLLTIPIMVMLIS